MPIYVGTQKIDVSGMDKVYVGTQLVYQKNVPIVLSSITISGQTTSLNRGASFSFGGTVTAHYSNGSTANVTSRSTFSGYNMNTAGTYTVTVKYTEDGITATTTYSLTVNKVWTQLWSGSKALSWTLQNAVPSSVDVYTSSFANNSDIRITFTMSNKIGTYSRYVTNGTQTTTKPSSPYRISTFATGTSRNILGVGASHTNNTSTSQRHKDIYLYFDTSTKKFTLKAVNGGSGGDVINSGTISLTITKIERYY